MYHITRKVNPLAGKLAPLDTLVDIPKLITAYYTEIPDPNLALQRVSFGTSGHRGSAFDKTFNEWHILAITQAICLYRKQHNITGPLFIGFDTHALSRPAFASALEVLAANGVDVMIAKGDEYTPTPVISHAILTYNKNRNNQFADGIVITPSHNPPHDGGFKYNPPHGGPADITVTTWIEKTANTFLENKLQGIKRMLYANALRASTTHTHDYLNAYVNDLGNVIDMQIIQNTHIHLGVDPLGGAGVHYWEPIAERYGINLSIVSKVVDPTFRFMTIDWDGQIRMDPSSTYAMVRLIALRERFDIAFACDTDHDRFGIVTHSAGLMPPNHFLAIAISYLYHDRTQWDTKKAVGKTIVSSAMIDRITKKLGRSLYEVPVGFKWFVEGLVDGSLGFGGEESAGAAFSRLNGQVWTSDKDGIITTLLSAEITARMGKDLGEVYTDLENEFGKTFYERDDVKATPTEKQVLKNISLEQIKITHLAGDNVDNILIEAPGNKELINGFKVITANGWFAARPSGTEDIYKIYAESFQDDTHLQTILTEAQTFIKTLAH